MLADRFFYDLVIEGPSALKHYFSLDISKRRLEIIHYMMSNNMHPCRVSESEAIKIQTDLNYCPGSSISAIQHKLESFYFDYAFVLDTRAALHLRASIYNKVLEAVENFENPFEAYHRREFIGTGIINNYKFAVKGDLVVKDGQLYLFKTTTRRLSDFEKSIPKNFYNLEVAMQALAYVNIEPTAQPLFGGVYVVSLTDNYNKPLLYTWDTKNQDIEDLFKHFDTCAWHLRTKNTNPKWLVESNGKVNL